MHSGITLFPLIGRLAAVEILDRVQVELLRPFRLARFA
jgi:glycine/D-amino acid oxidase-like deaminating enzyme